MTLTQATLSRKVACWSLLRRWGILNDRVTHPIGGRPLRFRARTWSNMPSHLEMLRRSPTFPPGLTGPNIGPPQTNHVPCGGSLRADPRGSTTSLPPGTPPEAARTGTPRSLASLRKSLRSETSPPRTPQNAAAARSGHAVDGCRRRRLAVAVASLAHGAPGLRSCLGCRCSPPWPA